VPRRVLLLLRVVLLTMLAGCGDMQVVGEGGSEATDDGPGTSGTSEDGGSETGETGGEPSPCYGGSDVDVEWGLIDSDFDDDLFWDWVTPHQMSCPITEITEQSSTWTASMSCQADGIDLGLSWMLDKGVGLVDSAWVGRVLAVVGTAGNHPHGNALEGWFVIRDEQGELLWISGRRAIPDPAWTQPLTVSLLDLGSSCSLGALEPCVPEHGHALLFESAQDGELRAYGGLGHITDAYIYRGESIRYEDLATPFGGECEPFNGFVGLWSDVLVVRRP
jgi:hypothetical protein